MSLRRKIEVYPIKEIYVAERGRELEHVNGEYTSMDEDFDLFSGESIPRYGREDVDGDGNYVDPLTGETHDVEGHFLD